MANEFFALGFPHGRKDLPIPYPLNDFVWETLRALFYQEPEKPNGRIERCKSYIYHYFTPKDLIPQNLVFDLYDALKIPLFNNAAADLKAGPGGTIMAETVEAITRKITTLVPGLLASQSPLLAADIVELINIKGMLGIELERWFDRTINVLGNCQNESLVELWQFIGKYITSTINHCLVDLRNNQYQSVIELYHFFRDTTKPRLLEIENIPSAEERKRLRLNVFRELSDRIITVSGFDKADKLYFPFFNFLILELITVSREKLLPDFFLDLYEDVTAPQRTLSATQKKLKTVLFDENYAFANLPNDARGVSLRALYRGEADPQSELWDKSGVTEASMQIEKGNAVISQSIKEAIRVYIDSEPGETAQLLIDLIPNKNISPVEQAWLSGLIKSGISNPDPFVNEVLDYAKLVIERALLKVFINIADKTEKIILVPVGTHTQTSLLSNVAVRLLGIIHRNAGIKEQIAACDAIPNKDEREQRLRSLFVPMSREFLSILLENPLTELPMSRYLKDELWDVIQTHIIPHFMEKFYRKLYFWQSRGAQNKQILNQIFQTTHPEEASKVIAHFGGEYLPYYMTFAHQEVAEKLLNLTQDLVGGDPQLVQYLHGHHRQIADALGYNIQQYGDSSHPAIQAVKPFTTALIEGLMLKLFANLTTKINQKEIQQPTFIVDSLIEMLRVTTSHFVTINRITRVSGKSNAWKIPYDEMLHQFDGALHRGIPDNALPAQAQLEFRLTHFYGPLTNRLFRILDIENDPQFREFLSNEAMRSLWRNCQTHLFPRLLHSIFEKLMEPHTIRTMLLNSLETLNTALTAIPQHGAEVVLDEAVQEDVEQLRLNEACGLLVKQLLDLVPRTFAHSVFEIDRVQNMASQTIGQAVRKALKKWTWIKIIDQGIMSGLPSFRMGRWEGVSRIEKFVPLKILAGPEGREVIEPDQLTFNFPKTERGKELLEAQRRSEEHQTEARLRHLMAVMTSRQIKSNIENVIKSFWDRFQHFIDETIGVYFGLVGVKIKVFGDIACRVVFFEIIGTALKFLFSPINSLFWYLLEEFLSAKADDLSKDAIHPIQENLLFNLMDKFLDNFDPNPAPLPVIAPVVA